MTAAHFCARIFAERTELFAAMTEILAAEIRTAGSENESEVCVALAGGETPQGVYKMLQECDLPWAETNFYPTDERCVAEESPRRNDNMLRNCLGGKARVFSLEEGATPPPLHIALLGVGEDSHIASLFPGAKIDSDTIFRTTPTSVPEPRLTIPLSAFVNAKKIFLLLCGEKKWAALSRPSTPVAALLNARKVEVFYAP